MRHDRTRHQCRVAKRRAHDAPAHPIPQGVRCEPGMLDPAAVTEWFHERDVDAHDWVMVPNVVGMSQFGDGDGFVTKPYIAGGRCIDRMSDDRDACPCDPERTSGPTARPLPTLSWAFIERHGRALRGVGRMDPVVRAWERRPEADRFATLARAEEVRQQLADGTA